jgi:hypothetical protein
MSRKADTKVLFDPPDEGGGREAEVAAAVETKDAKNPWTFTVQRGDPERNHPDGNNGGVMGEAGSPGGGAAGLVADSITALPGWGHPPAPASRRARNFFWKRCEPELLLRRSIMG